MDVPMPHDDSPIPDRPFPVITAAGVALVLSTYLGMIALMYLVNVANQPADPARARDVSPEQKLAELKAEDQARQNGYRWNDQPAGVVGLPIERGMELYAREGKLPLERQPKPPAPPATKK
jgi:hypothetical protein